MNRFAYLLPVLVLAFSLGCSTTQTKTTAYRSTASESLTEYDKHVINIYVKQGYREINNYLRQSIAVSELDAPFQPGFGIPSENVHKFYVQLNKALQKAPRFVTENGKNFLYRGALTFSAKPEDRYVKGQVFRELGYGSATKYIAVADKFMNGQDKFQGQDLEMKEKYKHMIFIKISSLSARDISGLNQEEAEVLFPPGVVFRVDQAERKKPGHYFVMLTELDPAKMSDAERAALKKSDDLHRDKRLKEAYMQDGAKSLDQKAMAADIATAKADYKKRIADGILLREDLKYEDIVEPGYD